MIVYVKDQDEELVIPVGLGPNVGPEPSANEQAENQE